MTKLNQEKKHERNRVKAIKKEERMKNKQR